MSDRPQYPSYPGGADEPASGPPQPGPPPGWGQVPPPPAYGYPQQGYGYVPSGYGYPPAPPTTSGKAVTAMVLGIVSIALCWIGVLMGVAAIIVSVLARKEISAQRPGTMSGAGMATAGLVTGIIGTVVWGGIIAVTILDTTVNW